MVRTILPAKGRLPAVVASSQVTRLGCGTAPLMSGYGLGTARASHTDDAVAVLREAVAGGMRYLDTAVAYEIEGLLRGASQFLQEAQVRICVKLSVTELAGNPLAALRRVGCARVDTLLVHNAGRSQLLEDAVARQLLRLRDDGVARFIGASTYGAQDAQIALEQSWCDVVQIEHSLVNPSVMHALTGRKRSGQQLIARSVLCKGLLTARRSHATHLGEAVKTQLDRLDALAHEWGLQLPQLAIRFALETPGIDTVLVGLSGREEVETALAAARGERLAPWQLEALRAFDGSAEDWSHPERWG